MHRVMMKRIGGCLLLLAAAGLLAACGRRRARAVILISIDTLRRDHLGCYGYGRDTSPVIDRFARKEAVLFEQAYAQAPYTLPSHMSMLTGLYPDTHGVLLPFRGDGSMRSVRLAEGVETLAEVLKGRGFATSAFTDGVLVDGKFGFGQGFDAYRDERDPDYEKNGFRRYGIALHQWIRDHANDDFFLFVHTYDTHSPYAPPEPFRSRFAGAPSGGDLPQGSTVLLAFLGVHRIQMGLRFRTLPELVDVYDGCIAFVDHELGKLFQVLRETGRWEEALVIVTSDHGQSFMENGCMVGHGVFAGNEEILVPLIVKFPGSAFGGRRVEHVVESVDLVPTVCSVLGIPAPAACQGQDLLCGVRDGRWSKGYAFGVSPSTGGNHYLVKGGIKFMEEVRDPGGSRLAVLLKPRNPPGHPRPDRSYLEHGGEKFFYDFEDDPLGLKERYYRGDRAFDLSKSLYEWKARRITDREVLGALKKEALALEARARKAGEVFRRSGGEGGAILTPEERQSLEALGYGGLAGEGGRPAIGMAPPREGVHVVPPPVDRSELYRGDCLLWEVMERLRRKAEPREGARSIPALLEEARACFERFAADHPEKKTWTDWRLRYLEQARRTAGRKGR